MTKSAIALFLSVTLMGCYSPSEIVFFDEVNYVASSSSTGHGGQGGDTSNEASSSSLSSVGGSSSSSTSSVGGSGGQGGTPFECPPIPKDSCGVDENGCPIPVDLETDADNCGACGWDCPEQEYGMYCSNFQCTPPDLHCGNYKEDCNGLLADGCEDTYCIDGCKGGINCSGN